MLFDSASAAVEISDGSVKALYHLENTVDSSGNGYNLTNNGSVGFNGAVFSNGGDTGSTNTTEWLSISDDYGIDGESWSFAGWVNITTQPDENYDWVMVNQDDITNTLNYVMYTEAGGTSTIGCTRQATAQDDADVRYNTTLSTGVWYHLICTYDGTSGVLNFYLNNVLVGTSNGNGNGNASAFPDMTLLFKDNNNSPYFRGLMDEVVFLNAVMSTSTRAAIYSSSTGEICVTAGCADAATSTASSSDATAAQTSVWIAAITILLASFWAIAFYFRPKI